MRSSPLTSKPLDTRNDEPRPFRHDDRVARVRDQVDHVHRFIKRAMRFNSTYFTHSLLCNRLKISVSKKATQTRHPLFHASWKYLFCCYFFYLDQGIRALVGFGLLCRDTGTSFLRNWQHRHGCSQAVLSRRYAQNELSLLRRPCLLSKKPRRRNQ